jgi:hypothetical protein
MKTGSIDVDNGEAKVVGAKREGGSAEKASMEW